MSIVSSALLDDIEHPNRDKYPNQRAFVIAVDSYVYVVPYVGNGNGNFFKTAIPGRKATKNYLGESE